MKNYFFSILVLFCSTTIFAQTGQIAKQKAHKKSFSNDLSVQASNLRSDTIDILNYNISLNITDFTTDVIKGNTKVKFTPKVNGINKIDLDLLMLTIDSIEIAGTNLTYGYDDTLLIVNLPATLNIGDTVDLSVFYHGTPQGDASGWGGFYFQSGYAYNLGVGFAALPHVYGRVWFPCFDNFVERTTYEFNITTNGGKIAYCNGYLAHDSTDVSGNRTRRWIMNTAIPSYLASVSIGSYTQINQTYNGIAATVPIIIAAVPADTTIVKNSFVNLPLALSTFENHFGPYMWNRVGYCMVPFSSGAMEHATNISYPKSFATGTTMYQNLFVHELSHHWFGDLATCRTAEDMWLNEGWAHYCEFLFYEALSGHPTYLTNVRSNHADNLQFIQYKEGGYLTLSNIPQTYTYGDHVYNKGADVAHTLRGYLGDSLFYYSVKTYLAGNHFKDVSSLDFQNALTTASGMDMSDFFNGWVNNPGWPHFSIDSTVAVPVGGGNYSVTIYVKQKLTGAPAYFNNVPLEVTFKAANWNEQIKKINMSGANSAFTFTLPFNPVFTAVNMGEKISHAVVAEYKTVKTISSAVFSEAKMNIVIQSISDSALIRVEHNFAAPDPIRFCCKPYRLSPNHYWKVDGILPANFKARASLTYEGRTTSFSGNYYLDDQLIDTYEDSLVLMYRRNAADDWNVYPYYTKNMLSSNNDKHGTISIDTLALGEYAFAMMDHSLAIQDHATTTVGGIKVFPNPSRDYMMVDVYATLLKIPENATLVITDTSGKIMYKEKIGKHDNAINVNTSGFANGVYAITIQTKNGIIAKDKFIVAH